MTMENKWPVPSISEKVDVVETDTSLSSAQHSVYVFISYRHQKPDDRLAHAFKDGLLSAGHQVFIRPRAMVTIRAPRQTGKTSLLVAVYSALQHGVLRIRPVFVDFQLLTSDDFLTINSVWYAIATQIGVGASDEKGYSG